MGCGVIRRAISAWVLERNQSMFAYLGNDYDFGACGRAEGRYLGINVTEAFIFAGSSAGLGSSTCVDLLGSGYVCGCRFSGSGLESDTDGLKKRKGSIFPSAT